MEPQHMFDHFNELELGRAHTGDSVYRGVTVGMGGESHAWGERSADRGVSSERATVAKEEEQVEW